MPELAAEPRTEAHVQLLGVVAITGLFADHVAPLGSAPKLVAAVNRRWSRPGGDRVNPRTGRPGTSGA